VGQSSKIITARAEGGAVTTFATAASVDVEIVTSLWVHFGNVAKFNSFLFFCDRSVRFRDFPYC
jgi:hypothetical protein